MFMPLIWVSLDYHDYGCRWIRCSSQQSVNHCLPYMSLFFMFQMSRKIILATHSFTITISLHFISQLDCNIQSEVTRTKYFVNDLSYFMLYFCHSDFFYQSVCCTRFMNFNMHEITFQLKRVKLLNSFISYLPMLFVTKPASIHMSAFHAVGCGFMSMSVYTKDNHKNGTNCLSA